MEPITPFDWQRIFFGSEPPLFFLEIVFRVVLIYAFAVLMLRVTGKRGQRQMSRFELILIIALGSATGDSMLYPEVPILYAWLIITVMVGLNWLLGIWQIRSKRVNSFLQGDPRLLVQSGKIMKDNAHKEHLRPDDVLALLREQEIKNTGEIEFAFLEETGNLGLLRYAKGREVAGESTFPPDLMK